MFMRVGYIYICISMMVVKLNGNRNNLMEMRLSTLEMRMNIEIQDIKSVLKLLETGLGVLNTSLGLVEKRVCDERGPNTNTDGTEQNQAKVNRVIKALMTQKSWLHSIVSEIENQTMQNTLRNIVLEEKISQEMSKQIESIKREANTTCSKVKVLESKVRQLDQRETKQEERFLSVEEKTDLLKTSLASLAEKNDRLNADIVEMDVVIERLGDEIRTLQYNNKQPEEKNTCPTGWQKFRISCYLFVNQWMRYSEAKIVCSDKGATLVDIQNKEENDFVSQLFKGTQIWIGMTDEETEGEWKWERTGQIATYLNWRPGQPNNYLGQQHYAVFEDGFQGGLWDDISMYSIAKVVCKTDGY